MGILFLNVKIIKLKQSVNMLPAKATRVMGQIEDMG